MTISELPDRVFINDPKTYSDGETTPGTWTIKPDWCFKHVYRRADLPPTLSAAMELPEVKALVEDVTRQIENIDDWLETSIPAGPIKSKSIYDQMRAALAAIKETKT